MKILFWGTPAFAVPSLRVLDDEGFEIVGVVTQPDRPAGRGRRLVPSEVRSVALDLGLPVLTPERPRGEEFLERIRALAPDVSVVVAYGHILRPEILEVPPLGSLNVHASLLPELRGAAPIHWAIARGYAVTGVTIMRMAEAMDAGPILRRVEEPILPAETSSELTLRLSEIGAEALLETLTLMAEGVIEEEEQDHARATLAPKVDRATARITWARPAVELSWHVRAMDGVPGAWTELEGVPIKLYRPEAVEEADAPAGTILAAEPERGLVVATGAGALRLAEVQPPGRRRMSAGDWIHGRGVRAGQRFV